MIKLSGKRLYATNDDSLSDKIVVAYVPNDKNYKLVYNHSQYDMNKDGNKLVWDIPNEAKGNTIQFHINAYDTHSTFIYSSNSISVKTTKPYIQSMSVDAGNLRNIPTPLQSANSQLPLYTKKDQHPAIPIVDRTIKMPKNYEILISGDTQSQLLTFEINRFYDGVDLSEKACSIVYYNALGRSDRAIPITIKVTDKKMKVGWRLDNNVSISPGVINFQLVFLGYEDENLMYVWHTEIAEFAVGDSLFVNDKEVVGRYPTVIEDMLIKLNIIESMIGGETSDQLAQKLLEIEGSIAQLEESVVSIDDTISDMDFTLGEF